jgi:hypothetical protein
MAHKNGSSGEPIPSYSEFDDHGFGFLFILMNAHAGMAVGEAI